MKLIIIILLCYICRVSCDSEQQEWLTQEERTKLFGNGSVPIYGMVTIDPSSRRIKRSAVNTWSLAIPFTDGTTKHLNLKKTDGILADSNTPVWFAYGSPNSDRIKYNRHMTLKSLGNFAFYQDYDHKASVVIFYDLDRIEGMIGHYHFKRIIPSKDRYILVPKDQHPYVPAVDNIPKRRSGEVPGGRYNHPKTVYPQLLLQLEQLNDKEDVINLLRSTLLYWNAVDMLYSNIKEPLIKINIAGIIIPKNKFTTPWITKSAVPGRDTTIYSKVGLDELGRHFEKSKNVFPEDEYDIMIHFTGKHLDPVLGVLGLSFVDVSCGLRAHQANIINKYSSYITAAHELAHIFSVPHSENTKQCAYSRGIMSKETQGVSEGFHWSECDRNYIKKYFSMKTSHCFDNFPKIKRRHHNRSILSEPLNCLSTPKGICGTSGRIYSGFMTCKVIHCKDNNGIIYKANVLEGTICTGRNAKGLSACYQGQCIPAKSKHYCPRTGRSYMLNLISYILKYYM